jgi:hypothetical protein
MFLSGWRKANRGPRQASRLSSRNGSRPRTCTPQIEYLENRLVPATITVTSTIDAVTVDAVVSLREAITSINAGADTNADVTAGRTGSYGTNDTINFNITGTAVQTIAVGSAGLGALPTITKPVTIDGYSQTGASANTLAVGDNAKILIELNGAGAGFGASGLTLTAGGSTVRGLAINRFSSDGILVMTGGGNTITGNFLGTNPAGTVAESNAVDGIQVNTSSNNTIGGTTPGARNVSSGNGTDGIHIVGSLTSPATGNVVQGNYVGVNAAGTGSVAIRPSGAAAGTPAGNFVFGIEVDGGNSNTIGGTTTGAGNVVGFNAAGIELDNGAQNNVVQGNFSGVGADGTTPVGNVLHGVVLRSKGTGNSGQANEPGVSNNLVGGTVAGAGNTVEFNGTGGVAVFGNPNSVSGQQNTGNAILGNVIFSNGRSNPSFLLGIDLVTQFAFPKDDGVTVNTSGTHTTGPNLLQNFPVLTSVTPATGGGTTIVGTLSSTPSTTFRIEFFASGVGGGKDTTGVSHGEGQTFLGFTSVSTNASGTASFTFPATATVALGQFVSATATDSANNTSEFSADVQVPNQVPAIASLSPPSVTVVQSPLPITILGTNFASNATVQVNGTALTPTFVSSTQLQATLPATLLAQVGTLNVTVVNPGSGGGTSNTQTFTVQGALLPGGIRGTANQRFVAQLYHDLLQRPVDAGGLAFWSGLLDQGASLDQVVLRIETDPGHEYYAALVQNFYVSLLGRPEGAGDAPSAAGFVNLLATGQATDEQVQALFVSSAEYLQTRANGGNVGFVNALYLDALKRPASDSGALAFEQQLNQGNLTRAQVATMVFSSDEFRQALVQSFYQRFLGRAADSSGLAHFSSLLKGGATDEQVIADLLGDPGKEYYNKASL